MLCQAQLCNLQRVVTNKDHHPRQLPALIATVLMLPAHLPMATTQNAHTSCMLRAVWLRRRLFGMKVEFCWFGKSTVGKGGTCCH